MKKITLLLLLVISQIGYAQITIPDANFKAALIDLGIDTSGNGEIEENEALAVTNLNLFNKNISDLDGIQFFTNLLDLNCETNQITNIDLSALTSLTKINFRINQLTSINLNSVVNLEELDLYNNQLTNINLSGLNNLKNLNLSSNPINNLDASNLTVLEIIELANCSQLTTINTNQSNSIKNINLTNSNSLSELICNSENLSSVILNGANALENLNLNASNQLTNIDLSGLNNLKTLNLSSNPVNNLDTSNLTALEIIEIANCSQLTTINTNQANSIKTINLTNSNSLSELICNSENLSSVILNGANALENLNLSASNQLTNIDLSGLNNLKTLNLSSNPITNLDTSNLTALEIIELINCSQLTTINTNQSNLLKTINLTNSNSLSELICNSENLSSVILNGANALENLNLSASNQLTNIDLSETLNLKFIDLSSNPITNLNLDFFGFTDLSKLETLNLVNCIELINLDLPNTTNLKDVNLLNASSVQELFIQSTKLNSVNVANMSGLEDLYIGGIDNTSTISSLDLSNLISLKNLEIGGCYSLTSLNLNGNQNLERIDFTFDVNPHSLTNVDFSNLINLKTFNCITGGSLTSVNLNGATNLEEFWVIDNQLISVDFSDLTNLKSIDLSGNQLITLDVSNLTKLEYLGLGYNNQLETVFIKNGANETVWFSENPNLTYICTDDSQVADIQSTIDSEGIDAVVNSYCSFTPGGNSYKIEGKNTLDINSDGCNATDPIFASLKYNITDGTNTGTFIANLNGDYLIDVNEGSHTITPVLENSTYYSISPETITVNFSTNTTPFEQDFCITTNGDFNDISVEIIPLEPARPGFDIPYKIIYKNVGTTTLNGTIIFNFENELMDVFSIDPLETSQSTGSVTWNYTDLTPFEEREINIVMNINTPTDTPAVNGDDILTFSASTPFVGDSNPKNNTVTLRQTVVNSFDPNDKTCIQGDKILPESVGEYLNYMIRFENTGTANAINIVVKDVIDTDKFDIETLIPLKASHNFVTKIRENNIVEFIFENINLPFDDANNDGYVTFKIKTLDTLGLNDIIENNAEIYFDFNFPIITNIAQTQVVETLNINNYNLDSKITSVYPNPTENMVQIKSKENIESITVYTLSGRLIQQKNIIGYKNKSETDLSKLASGIYFLKINTESSEEIKKVIKQ